MINLINYFPLITLILHLKYTWSVILSANAYKKKIYQQMPGQVLSDQN